MTERPAAKFHISNLDCASCAAKLEDGLNQLEGVTEAIVDFASLTLHVKANDIKKVLKAARSIDPDIVLEPHSSKRPSLQNLSLWEGLTLKRGLWLLIIAGTLFLGLLIFEEELHRRQWFLFEIIMVLAAYLLVGWNVLLAAWRTVIKGAVFDENVLMVIATGGALAIHAYSEAVGVMVFYKVGEMLQQIAVNRSRYSIQALLSAKPDRAMVKTADGIRNVSPETVSVGDVIVVKPGEKIPLDGEIIEGQSYVDTSALTGEPTPISAKRGHLVMAGQISKTGALTIRVTREFKESSMAKIMDQVENATARKARTEKFITIFARYYTPAVVAIAAGIAFLPPLIYSEDYQPWIYRALVILVISCPCALVISIPLGYFGGIGRASKEGILVKGSNFIDVLAAVKTVVFDKTGTLTHGVFKVNDVIAVNGFSKEQLLEYAAAAEYQSNHPIATSILSAYKHMGGRLDVSKITNHIDYSGQGVETCYGEQTVYVGNDSLLHNKGIEHGPCEFGSTVVHVAVDGKYAGYLMIGDEIRSETPKAVADLRALGVTHVSMLTGDNHCTAKAISHKIGLDSVYADLLPEDKVRLFERIEKSASHNHKIAFVGDGINDAPAIARADVGVAMGGIGSDAAIETADVVFVKDSPLKTAQAIRIAKQTRRIVWQNIALAFVVKGFFLTFGAMGLASMWEAVFADMGTALLAVANSTRILKSG